MNAQPVLWPFEEMRLRTLCPYAGRARITYGPRWSDADSPEVNLRRAASSCARWAGTARENASHGFVMEVGLTDAGDFEAVRIAFGATLRALNERDPNRSECMGREIDSTEWQYEFAGERLFVNVFAPCYQPPHGKHVDAEGRFYIFFQPEFSFDLCGIDSSNRAAKETIRRIFSNAGCPYDGDAIDRRIEAYLYLFPLDPADGPVRWWH